MIGISGKIKSGKDTVGKIIQCLTTDDKDFYQWFLKEPIKALNDWNGNFDNLGDWSIKKYAYKLKQIVSILTDCSIEDLEDQDFKDTYLPEEWGKLTYRDVLKMVGGDYKSGLRYELHPDCWVNALFANYHLEATNWDNEGNTTVISYPKWLITDLRFPNEYLAIKERNGILIRVNRNNIPIGNHESETGLDNYKFDYVIDNNGTIEELIEKVRQILIKEKII